MSGSTKLWVDDTMYLVDDEVAEFIEQLQSQLAAEQEKNKWLHDALEVCEGCGNTTKIDDENYLLWCKTCWEKVVFENKRLREALETCKQDFATITDCEHGWWANFAKVCLYNIEQFLKEKP